MATRCQLRLSYSRRSLFEVNTFGSQYAGIKDKIVFEFEAAKLPDVFAPEQ